MFGNGRPGGQTTRSILRTRRELDLWKCRYQDTRHGDKQQPIEPKVRDKSVVAHHCMLRQAQHCNGVTRHDRLPDLHVIEQCRSRSFHLHQTGQALNIRQTDRPQLRFSRQKATRRQITQGISH